MGEPIFGYYFPLFGWNYEPVGMFFAGYSNAETVARTTAMQRILIAIGLWGTVIAGFIMYLLISRALKPLGSLTKTVKEVVAGNINVNINRDNLPNDETGILTRDVINLIDVIRAMVEDLSKAYNEFWIVGNVNFTIENPIYQNSFKEVIGLVNKLLSQTSKDVIGLADILNQVGSGDFDVNVAVEKWAGEWSSVPKAVNNLTGNLKAISNELNTMIEVATIKGDLDYKIETDKYKGDWRRIMVGLIPTCNLNTAIQSVIYFLR